MEYIIVGDTKNYKDCLVCVCKGTYEEARQTLLELTTNPKPWQQKMIEGHTNLRIQETKKEDCWWHWGD